MVIFLLFDSERTMGNELLSLVLGRVRSGAGGDGRRMHIPLETGEPLTQGSQADGTHNCLRLTCYKVQDAGHRWR